MKSSRSVMPIPRPLALTMPAVTVPSSPKGSPRANTQSPTSTLLLSPSRAAGSGPAPLMRSTAKSVFGSVLMSTALNSRPSCRRTMTWPPPATTWLFVKMTPLGINDQPGTGPHGAVPRHVGRRKRREFLEKVAEFRILEQVAERSALKAKRHLRPIVAGRRFLFARIAGPLPAC